MKMKIRNLLVVAVGMIGAAIVGCAMTPDIVPIGNGKYELVGTSAAAVGPNGVDGYKLVDKTVKFCRQQGKQKANLENLMPTAALAGANGANIVFSCE